MIFTKSKLSQHLISVFALAVFVLTQYTSVSAETFTIYLNEAPIEIRIISPDDETFTGDVPRWEPLFSLSDIAAHLIGTSVPFDIELSNWENPDDTRLNLVTNIDYTNNIHLPMWDMNEVIHYQNIRISIDGRTVRTLANSVPIGFHIVNEEIYITYNQLTTLLPSLGIGINFELIPTPDEEMPTIFITTSSPEKMDLEEDALAEVIAFLSDYDSIFGNINFFSPLLSHNETVDDWQSLISNWDNPDTEQPSSYRFTDELTSSVNVFWVSVEVAEFLGIEPEDQWGAQVFLNANGELIKEAPFINERNMLALDFELIDTGNDGMPDIIMTYISDDWPFSTAIYRFIDGAYRNAPFFDDVLIPGNELRVSAYPGMPRLFLDDEGTLTLFSVNPFTGFMLLARMDTTVESPVMRIFAQGSVDTGEMIYVDANGQLQIADIDELGYLGGSIPRLVGAQRAVWEALGSQQTNPLK